MDIGVLTLYKVRNLGACLQATAMKLLIEGYGHHVKFLKGYDSDFAKQLLKNDTGDVRPWNIPFLIQKEIKFRKCFKTFSEAELYESDKMDGVIIGSDSLWVADYGKDPMPTAFFGDVNCDVICSYAPSVGGKYDLSKYFSEQLDALSKLKCTTVRDSVSQKFFRDVTGKDCAFVIDPTLLCDWNDYLKQLEKADYKKDYILVYGGFDKRTTEAIKQFALREHIEVINVGSFNRHFRKNVAVSPDEFVRYIKNAKYVITSMFHGVMLSIALGKEFRYVSADPNRDIKISTTIEKLDLNSVMLKRENILKSPNIFNDKINYSKTNKLLEGLRTSSRSELEKMLELMSNKL